MGFADQAQARAHEALTLARELKQPYSEAYALCCCAFVSQFRRDAGQTRDQAEAAMALATEHGFAPWVAVATGFLGWALGEQGESEKGLAILQRGVAALQAMRAGIWFPFRCTMLAEVLDLAGKTKGALQSLAEARTTMDQTQEHWWEAEVYRLQGELLWRHAMVPLSEVESLLRRAVDTARRQGARSFELRATTSLARLWLHQGKQAEAHGLLASIHGWFTEGFETPDFKDAKALLEELHRRTA
jgi:predicted ATPase